MSDQGRYLTPMIKKAPFIFVMKGAFFLLPLLQWAIVICGGELQVRVGLPYLETFHPGSVASLGITLFGDLVQVILQFQILDTFLQLLNDVDTSFLGLTHSRQQLFGEIGRASCRERVYISVDEVDV